MLSKIEMKIVEKIFDIRGSAIDASSFEYHPLAQKKKDKIETLRSMLYGIQRQRFDEWKIGIDLFD